MTDLGYRQINSGIYPSLATTSPLGNAGAAVQISRDGTDWMPWITYQTGAWPGRYQREDLMAALIPMAVIALVLWGLVRFSSAEAWHLLVAEVLGVILSGTVLGPDISQVLSRLSGERLH